ADEALHPAEGGAVDDHRAVRLVVGADVLQAKTLREDVVDLHGAELPLAADEVLHDEVDLRAVEGGLARLGGVGNAERCGGALEGAPGGVPELRIADELVAVRVAQADADAVVAHAQRAED